MHRSLAEWLIPYLEKKVVKWQDMLPSVAFAMNSSVNSSLGYSLHEIVFWESPTFPLSSPSRDLQLQDRDLQLNSELCLQDRHSYMKEHAKKLDTIRVTPLERLSETMPLSHSRKC